MMAQPFPHHAGIAPGHPGMATGHPMGMQHPGAAHMGGQPGPGMMQGMHPGVSAPQSTQGPMVTGMPPGAGTAAPGPMHNGMAMAHLGPQQAMFQQNHPQMNYAQGMITPQQQQFMARQRIMQQMAQGGGMPMGMPGQQGFNQAQLAQMKMGMAGMHPQMQMNPNHPQMQSLQQHQHNQQQLMRAQQAQAQAQQHAVQMAAAAQSQRAAAQQMQMSRSQEQTTQPPPPQPTPAPQTQAPQQPPPTSQPQQQPAQPKPQPPQPQQQPTPNSQQSQPPNQSVKTSEPEEEPQIKQQPDTPANMMMSADIGKQDMSGGQCILRLIAYQDILANPDRPHDLEFWEQFIGQTFSPSGSLRQQFYSIKSGGDKSFQLQFPSLARYYHSYFAAGVRQILLQSFEHTQTKTGNGSVHITSNNASLTYVFDSDLRVTTNGQLRVLFNEMAQIEHLNISCSGWQEYIPRAALMQANSPDMKQSPKITNKNVKRTQGKANGPIAGPVIPSSGVGEWGVPQHISQFLEIAEVMTAMGPLMEYYHVHPGTTPKDSLLRVTNENTQATNRFNAMARATNGQIPFPNQMNPGMNGPNMMNSPAMGHLSVPQAQGSPMMGGPVHTPSPAQNPNMGGVGMMHQMSAQGSNLSGSQGPSTNTSPNVSNKRRRASVVKLEEENAQSDQNGGNKVKASPKVGGKRQKGSA